MLKAKIDAMKAPTLWKIVSSVMYYATLLVAFWPAAAAAAAAAAGLATEICPGPQRNANSCS